MALGQYLGASSITKRLYHFEGNGNDSSGNGNNLTPSNITYGGGVVGSQCSVYNGTDGKYTGTHGLGTGNISFSFSCWVFVTGTQSRGEILAIGNPAILNQGIFFFLRPETGGNDAVHFDYSANNGNYTTQRVIYNKWNFIQIIKSLDTIIIGINGIFEIFTKASLNIQTSTLILGSLGEGATYLAGKIDEVILENIVWTNSYMRKQYTYQKGMFVI